VELRRFLVILTVVLFIVLSIMAWFYPSNDDFRADNLFWNGVRDISLSYPISPLESLSNLPSLPQGSTLILIPYLDFTPAELEGLNSFVTRGSILVLADDYGFGNQVLEYLGLKARFSGEVLLDPLFCLKNRWFPRVSHIISSPVTSDIESLVLNHATCLVDVDTVDILAQSSEFSFLDLNSNESWDEDEPTGMMPVISQHNLGSGKVILISDPSLLINSMEAIEGNSILIQNITAITTARLLIDQSHLPSSNLYQTKNLLASVRGFFITPIGAMSLVVLALTVTLMPVWHERRRR